MLKLLIALYIQCVPSAVERNAAHETAIFHNVISIRDHAVTVSVASLIWFLRIGINSFSGVFRGEILMLYLQKHYQGDEKNYESACQYHSTWYLRVGLISSSSSRNLFGLDDLAFHCVTTLLLYIHWSLAVYGRVPAHSRHNAEFNQPTAFARLARSRARYKECLALKILL